MVRYEMTQKMHCSFQQPVKMIWYAEIKPNLNHAFHPSYKFCRKTTKLPLDFVAEDLMVDCISLDCKVEMVNSFQSLFFSA